METNRLKQFCTIVETGNLRKAANLLGISHSGLSKSMKVFEDEVGHKVLQLSGRGIVVTDHGQALYARAGDFFKGLDQLLGTPEKEQSSVLRLGSFEVFTSYFIGPLAKEYLKGSDLEVHELVPGRLEEALSLRKIDLGITYEPIPRSGIEYVKVTSLSMGAFAKLGVFEGKELSKVPFVVPVSPLEGAPSGVKGRDSWPDEKLPRAVRYRVDLMATGLSLAREGLCAIFIPRFVARLHNEENRQALTMLELPKSMASIKRDVFIVKRESTPEDARARQIARALREICR